MNPVPSRMELIYLHLINEIFDYKTSLDSHGQNIVSGDVCGRADLKGPGKGLSNLVYQPQGISRRALSGYIHYPL